MRFSLTLKVTSLFALSLALALAALTLSSAYRLAAEGRLLARSTAAQACEEAAFIYTRGGLDALNAFLAAHSGAAALYLLGGTGEILASAAAPPPAQLTASLRSGAPLPAELPERAWFTRAFLKRLGRLPLLGNLLAQLAPGFRPAAYIDDAGQELFVQTRSLPPALLAAVVPAAAAYGPAFALLLRNTLLSLAVLAALSAAVWFLTSLTVEKLRALTGAANAISRGSFEVKLKAEGSDEVAELTRAVVAMGGALENFYRFSNRTVAALVAGGELDVTGERKAATVLSAGIQGFPEFLQRMEARELFVMLNDCVTRATTCIQKTGGVFERFAQGTITANWGMVKSTQNMGHDALNAIRTALLMRSSFKDYNIGRSNRDMIRLGIGIHSDLVIGGAVIGQELREYTLMGEGLRVAALVSTLNKSLGTDILITEAVWNMTREYVITEEMPSLKLPDRPEPLRLFAVINMKVTRTGVTQPAPTTLEEVRLALGIIRPQV